MVKEKDPLERLMSKRSWKTQEAEGTFGEYATKVEMNAFPV